MECGICFNIVPLEQVFKLRACGHRACRECYIKHVSTMILEVSVIVKCMECPSPMEEADILDILRDAPVLIDKFHRPRLDHYLFTHKEGTRCPAPDCEYGVLIPNRTACPRQVCGVCSLAFCSVCRIPWHEGVACDQAHAGELPGLFHVDSSEWGQTYQRCPNCRLVQTRDNDGRCNVVVCKVCQADFCWLCGKRFNIAHYFTSRCKYFGRTPFTTCQQLGCQLSILLMGPVLIPLFSVFLTYLFVWEITKLAYEKASKQFVGRSSICLGRALVFMYTAGAFGLIFLVSPLIFLLTVLVLCTIAYIIIPLSILRLGKIRKIPQALRNLWNRRGYVRDENVV